MELKPNTYYRTRGGRKAYVWGVQPPNPFSSRFPTRPVAGYVEGSDVCGDEMSWWKADGTSMGYPQKDLIAEWREPRSKTAWVCLYAYPDGTTSTTTFDDEAHARRWCAACNYTYLAGQTVTLTEKF